MYVTPSVVLWDFGDTLVDERWMCRCPDNCLTWETAWISVMNQLADQWNVGNVSFNEVAAAAMLMGALFADAMGREIMPDIYRNDPDEALDEYIRLFLRAIGVGVRRSR